MDKQAIAPLTPDQALEQLHSSLEGLSESEAETRRAAAGLNVLTKSKNTALSILVRQLKSSLIFMLAFACILSFVLGDLSDGIIIAVILIINTALSFVQEYRSEQAVAKLSTFISKKIATKRGGITALMDEAQLVPGDIVILRIGDIVPADAKLLSAQNVQVDESQLTGESQPVAKDAAAIAAAIAAAKDNASLLFAGSIVQKGEAIALVYATGNATELGTIASLSTRTHKITQYEKSLQSFSALLLWVSLITLGVTFVAKLLLTRDFSHIPSLLLFVIALAIAVVPEALPVIATLTLSTGAVQLAKHKVVAKRLSSIEDLGNITVLCTDKTGTLTAGRMAVQKITADDPARLLEFAYATLESYYKADAIRQNSFAAAFLDYIPPEVQQQAKVFKQCQSLPFDPDAKRRRMVIQDTGTCARYLVVIGAIETLLELSDVDPGKKSACQAQLAQDGQHGLRTLALAYRELPAAGEVDMLAYEQHLTFLGIVTLTDPLRPTTKQTIEQAEQLGVAIKILSGDSREVAAYVGSQIGLGGEVHTGDEIAHLSPEELRRLVAGCSVFARVTPAQKFAIIEALKHDHVVGYQGDGINDAPALKLADVGLAVDTATDVAKESADIVLLNPDLSVMIHGIRAGRAIFRDIDKYLKYTMVGNFGNLFAMAVLYLVVLDLPLLPVQLLLTSLITDLPLLTIATDTVDRQEILRPQKYNTRSLILLSVVLGGWTALFELAYFALITARAPAYVQTSMFLFLTFLQLVVIVSIRHRDSFWRGAGPSPVLAVAIALAFFVSLAMPYVPPIARLFAFQPLPLGDLWIVVGLAVVYVVVLDLIKVWYYRTIDKEEQPQSAVLPSAAGG